MQCSFFGPHAQFSTSSPPPSSCPKPRARHSKRSRSSSNPRTLKHRLEAMSIQGTLVASMVLHARSKQGDSMPAGPVTIDRKDPRFDTLKKGNNLRFPANDTEAPSRIVICGNAAETEQALQR